MEAACSRNSQTNEEKRSNKVSDVRNRVVFLPCTAMEILLLFHCYARCVSSLKTGRSSFIYLLASSSLFFVSLSLLYR